MIIIGLAGHPSSGKDTAADYIASRGFFHISLGDLLREEMTKQGLAIDRPSVRTFAREERAKRGAFYPVDIAVTRLQEKTVMSGFRNTAEVLYIKERFPREFKLIALSAPIEARYKRALSRNRIGDDISFLEFKAQEEAEKNHNPETHEVDNVLAMADITIENSEGLDEFIQKIDKLLASF